MLIYLRKKSLPTHVHNLLPTMHLQWLIFLSMVVVTSFATNTTASKTPNNISKPNCPQKCGNLTIPYPFGIGPECSMGIVPWFSIRCNTSYNPPKAFSTISLGFSGESEILAINMSQIMIRNTQIASRCYDSKGKVISNVNANFDIYASPFTYSYTANKLTVIGCDDYALVTASSGTTSKGNKQGYSVGCLALCSDPSEVTKGSCSGLGCCQTSIPSGLQSFEVSLSSIYNHTRPPEVASFQPCGYAFLAGGDGFSFGGASDFVGKTVVDRTIDGVPLVLDWVAGNIISSAATTATCKQAQKDQKTYACQANTDCVDFYRGGYHCNCLSGYEGNPYLQPGCTDIDECSASSNFPCSMVCVNTPGSYNCSCPSGYNGDGYKSGTGCTKNTNRTLKSLTLGLGIALGSILLLLGCWWMYSFVKRRNRIKLKAKNFERNGGNMLQEQMFSDEGVVQRITIFTIDELEKASDHFNQNRILGKGGQGTVYKGMLGEGRIVAIKKLKTVDESQVSEFTNEVVILSKINHRNIVRLLGCCLEMEVPLLVYEYIPNGTLFHHIHYPNEEFTITWKMRLQIATDSASALAYLHSSSSIPVFHRDIKSSNILLDDKYRAKLSDFGASRSVAIDQTHLTTRVLGTFGYLDPEYFQSSQFTEKSDVYSFGVVLVELLTGEKAIRSTSHEEKSLASWFLSHMENSRLFDIVDSQVLEEGSKEELLTIAKLAKRCLNLDGKKRPTMREVLAEIEVVKSLQLSQSNQKNWPETVQDWTETTESSHDGFSSCGISYSENPSSSFVDLPLLHNTR